MNAEEDEPTTAVVGVGNEIMSDDGVGPKVIETLESGSGPGQIGELPAVRLYDAGTTAFLALEAMSGCERAIVVDAIDTGDEPGTIREYRFVDGAFEGTPPDMTMHDVSFTEALQYSRDVYDLPDDVGIIGIQPATLEPGMELSESVADSIPDVIDTIATYIGVNGADCGRIESTANRPGGESTPGTGEWLQ